MTITVNDEPLEVTLETEKTALDLVSGISGKLRDEGMVMTDFVMEGPDARKIAGDSLATVPVGSIEKLSVSASGFADVEAMLAAQAAETADALEGIIPALEDTSVSLQTGKDRDAFDAIRKFSEQTDAATRIFSLLHYIGDGERIPTIGTGDAAGFFDSLNGVLRELAGAFESKDSVLVGDIAEYEIVPRLRDLIGALRSLAGR